MLNKIWKFLNSSVGLLLLGFCFTSLLGAIFSDLIQRRAWQHKSQLEQQRQDFEWKRSRKFELLRRKLNEGQKTIEDISDLINLRFFRLQKVYETVLSGKYEDMEKRWKEHMDAVEKWNVKLIINGNKLRRLVNSEISKKFNNYETDDPNLQNPITLHGKFFLAHGEIKKLFLCSKSPSCVVTKSMKSRANERLRSLDYASDLFVDEVSNLFLERTLALEEFQSLE